MPRARLCVHRSGSGCPRMSPDGVPTVPVQTCTSVGTRASSVSLLNAPKPISPPGEGQPTVTVDVLLPYYGDVTMMKQAVESILGQTSPDWTLTVIDDGYPDESIPGYFGALAARDPRITYVRNEKNLGANGNYRKALGFVRNDLAVIMGADDVMLANYIETVVAAHEQFPSAQIIQPGVEVIDENNQPGMGLADKIKSFYAPRVRGCLLYTSPSPRD